MLYLNHKINKKGVLQMKSEIQQATEILKKLSPENQAYLITLVRVAGKAEEGVKGIINKSCKSPKKNNSKIKQK